MKTHYLHVISMICLILLINTPLNLQSQNTWETNVPLGMCGGNCVTPLNGNGTLGQIYNNTQCGLNYVSSSQKLGQRFFPAGVGQPAAYNMVLPPCVSAANGNILRAYLWCGTSGNGAAITANITNPAGGSANFPMTIVGQGGDKCWGYTGTYTYRADVTSIITAGGNYIISGLPTNPPNAANDADGATLMIIYADPAATYQGTLVIHDGAVMIGGGATTQTVNGFNACANSTNAQAFCIAADIQMPVTSLTMNGTNAPFAWDWWNYVSVNTNVTAGQTSSNFTINTGGDCYNLAMIGLYYQTMGCATCPNLAANPLILNMASTPATCSACNGTATVTPSGVAGPYTYSWAPSGGSGPTATNLCAGTYTVTVSANGGCVTNTATVTITNSGSTLNITGTPTNVSCNGGTNGSINTNVTGGVGPYTYLWNPSGGTAASPTGLGAGTYTVTVTDVPNGCTQTQTFTITQPPVLNAPITASTHILCNGGNNGSATVTPNGGNPGYLYSWAPSGGTGATASGLGAGVYTVTVTDANTCTRTATVSITQPPVLTANITATTHVSCFGGNNGSATVTAGGGNPGYSYSWAPSGGTGATANNLTAGTYTVTVTDANACTRTATIIINQPPVLNASITASTNINCFGGNTGSAAVTASGGNPGYLYSWAPSGGTGATATGLGAGTYTVTVTDANTCTRTATVTLTQPPALINTIISSTPPTCNGWNDGDATANATGGTGIINYSWAPSGGTNAAATGLSSGIYTVTATDGNGCTATTTVSLVAPVSVVANITSVTPAQCNGASDGSAVVSASGGNGTYFYAWAPTGGTNDTALNLSAAVYTVTVTDGNGCTATASANVTQPNALTTNITAFNHVSCFGGNNGSATVTAAGGSGGNIITWAPSGGSANTAPNLTAGTYTVTVTDLNGCSSSSTVTINQPPVLTVGISVYDDITCFGANDGWANTNVSGGAGSVTYNWAPGGGTSANPTNMGPNNYTLTVTDSNNCQATATLSIIEPPLLTANITSTTDVNCNGNGNGSATVTAAGGDGTYTYLWNPTGVITAINNNLNGGTYSVTVTDGEGCTASASATINEPAVLTVTTSTLDNQLCIGDATNIDAIAAGGASGYTYAWSGGLPAVAIQNVSPGTTTTYTVTVTDANGCTSSSSITINVSPLPVPSFNFTNVCTGLVSTFTSTSTVGSGTITNTQWNYGDGSPLANGTPSNYTYPGSGTYNVVLTVTSDMGCTATATQAVTVYPGPVVNFSVNDPAGCVDHCVTFTDLSSVPGGSITTWNWTSNGNVFAGSSNPTTCFTNPGMYTIGLTVTTNNNCTATFTQNNYVQAYALPVAAFTLDNYQVPVYAPVVTITDGSVNAITWNYNLGDGNFSSAQNLIHQYPDTGTYCIMLTVTSPDGCTDTTQQCLYVYPEPSLFIPNSFTPNDDGMNEFFQAEGIAIKDFEMWIFNRWGQELFFTNSIDKGWNGNDNETPAPQGVYVYKIHVMDNLGNEHDYLGQVNLIR